MLVQNLIDEIIKFLLSLNNEIPVYKEKLEF